MPIQVLPSEVASQIAAGEVVERPASVVKELVENALDAKATHIAITIEEAGRKLIEVSDNGLGIPADELALAVARHATSKLHTSDDLFRIATLGFRGEALASIASVSRFTITSRPKDAEMGARLRIEAGVPGEAQAIGAPAGTVVRVEDLFHNVPARLKFLKKDATERRQIDALVARYAIAYPHVRFQLEQENRVALQTSGAGDGREVLASMYTPEIARQMLEVDTEYEDLSVKGYISPTDITRASRRELTFFVNGRWVQDASLSAAIVQAYHTMLMVGRFPLAVLFIAMPPEQLDVNVHPAKSEVRFRQGDQVFSGVQRAVRRALLAYTPVPTLHGQARWRLPSPDEISSVATDPAWQIDAEESQSPETVQSDAQPRMPQDGVPLLRVVGQVGAAYVIAEGPDGLYLVDQHAAHERVLFEKLLAQHKEKQIHSQKLLEPESVEVSNEASALLTEQLPLLANLGFEVEPFGPNTFKVRAIPALLLGSDPKTALRAIIEDFEEDETPLQNETEARIIARVCKRAAVKAGQTLSPDEQRALLKDLEACQSPRTCPHGRPTMIHLSIDLLERQFGRRGAR
jgi:DNA mismatch repair protein MutL